MFQIHCVDAKIKQDHSLSLESNNYLFFLLTGFFGIYFKTEVCSDSMVPKIRGSKY